MYKGWFGMSKVAKCPHFGFVFYNQLHCTHFSHTRTLGNAELPIVYSDLKHKHSYWNKSYINKREKVRVNK